MLKVVGSYSREIEEKINNSHYWVQKTLSGLFIVYSWNPDLIKNHKSTADYGLFI